MNDLILEQLRLLAHSLGGLHGRVCTAVAGEISRAVPKAVGETLVTLMGGVAMEVGSLRRPTLWANAPNYLIDCDGSAPSVIGTAVRGFTSSASAVSPAAFPKCNNFLEISMSAALVNDRQDRKPLSDQLDRLDRILDGLSDALNEGVADASREGVCQAVKKAVVELLTRQTCVRLCIKPAVPRLRQDPRSGSGCSRKLRGRRRRYAPLFVPRWQRSRVA